MREPSDAEIQEYFYDFSDGKVVAKDSKASELVQSTLHDIEITCNEILDELRVLHVEFQEHCQTYRKCDQIPPMGDVVSNFAAKPGLIKKMVAERFNGIIVFGYAAEALKLLRQLSGEHLSTPTPKDMYLVYRLGWLCGQLEGSEHNLSSLYKHRKVASSMRKKGHDQKQGTLKEALQLAEEKWRNGDERLHDAMARYLLRQFPDLPSALGMDKDKTRMMLLVHLRPIARRFGRLRGVKK